MPSLRCRLFVFALKHRHLLKFQPKSARLVYKESSLHLLRKTVEKGARFFGKLPAGFRLEPVKIGDLQAEWMIPPEST
ncbi:MAG: hypothetical protein AB1746_10545 [Candidatus Zixiibacteriota bacterium]